MNKTIHVVTNTVFVIFAITHVCSTAFAADKYAVEDPAEVVVEEQTVEEQTETMGVNAITEPMPSPEVERQARFKAIQNQEEWIAKLEKQLAGERSQLAEMKTAMATDYNLDSKQLEGKSASKSKK